MEHVSIWGTPFPAILNQKNSTGSAGGAKNSQNGGILVPPKMSKADFSEQNAERGDSATFPCYTRKQVFRTVVSGK